MPAVEIRRAKNAQDVATLAATEIVSTLQGLLAKQEVVHFALTGGTVGIKTLATLSENADFEKLDLTRLHIWWGDERYVEKSSHDRNANQAREALLSKVKLPEQNIHEFPAADSGLSVSEAAVGFEKQLNEVFGAITPKMDLTILGMGPDGHIASLFPEISYSSADIVSTDASPKPPSERLTFSYALLNRSTKVIFVVSGIDKAEAVEKVHTDENCDLPASKIAALDETIWFIDEAAGAAFWSC